MVNIKDFPLSAVVDGLINYLQFLFATPEITPDEYRWSPEDRASRIRISAPFVMDEEKPLSAPFIVVERGGFNKDDRIIDDLKSSNSNVMNEQERVMIWDGSLNIICGSRVAAEASSMANFLLINIEADRHGIAKTLKFVRNIRSMSVGPEVPTQKRDTIIRYQVSLSLLVSLQMGWKTNLLEPTQKFNRFSLRTVDQKKWITSNTGAITLGASLITDTSKNFGHFTTNNPQLLVQEFTKGWYYVRLGVQLYKVAEIVNSTTLRIVNDDDLPFVATETATGVTYDLLWNSVHLFIQLPTE